MSGDLEDFLRRAAERRKAKAAQQQPATPQRKPSQYSDRRTERVARPRDVDEVVTAEVVEDPNSFAARMRRVEQAKQAAAQAEADLAKAQKKAKGRGKGSAAAVALTGNQSQNLINMLRQSDGIQQAILLREILDRPEHRW